MRVKPIKIIIDTNLWISFLIGMKSAAVIRDLLTNETIEIVMTDILESEIMAVASRPKFSRYFAPESCPRLMSFSQDYPLTNIPQRCRDPKDDYLLELANVSQANFLITGDQDLTGIKTIGKCQILTLAEYCMKVAKRSQC